MSLNDNTGFGRPSRERSALAELVATAGLALSTIIAATAVSIGIARADTISGVVDNDMGMFALALLLGLIFIGMGGLTAIMLPSPRRHD
jgi:hypothetical protein